MSAFSVCALELVAISSSSFDAGNGTKLCPAPPSAVVSATVGAALALSVAGLAPVEEDVGVDKFVLSVSRRVFVGRGPKDSARMKDCRMYLATDYRRGEASGGERKGMKGASVGCLWMRETRRTGVAANVLGRTRAPKMRFC